MYWWGRFIICDVDWGTSQADNGADEVDWSTDEVV